jgi:hypothetical protein
MRSTVNRRDPLETQQSLHSLPAKLTSLLRYPIPEFPGHEESSRTTSHPNRVHNLSPAQPAPRLCQPTNLSSTKGVAWGRQPSAATETRVARRYPHVRNAVPA